MCRSFSDRSTWVITFDQQTPVVLRHLVRSCLCATRYTRAVRWWRRQRDISLSLVSSCRAWCYVHSCSDSPTPWVVHILMSAKTALELGCPIRGVLSFTSTSTCIHTCLCGHPSLSVTDFLVVTKLAVPFLPLVAVCLASRVKSSPSINLWHCLPCLSGLLLPETGWRLGKFSALAAVADILPNSSR
jgi:hypothetical protein